MANPFIGEIKIVGFGYAPRYWAFCNGQILSINQNTALFSLLGTTFGGDGRSTFALPNLQDKVPIHVGNGYQFGQTGGEQTHTLAMAEIPTHTHVLSGSSTVGNETFPFKPTGNLLAVSPQDHPAYTTPQNLSAMAPGAVADVGANQPHNNMQPFLALNFCIALSGIFPSRN